MPLPRFRIRTLMIAVLSAGVGFAIVRTMAVKGYVSEKIGLNGPVIAGTPVIDVVAAGAIIGINAHFVIVAMIKGCQFIVKSRR